MIPVLGYRGRRVAVLGLGRSGRAVLRALAAGGAEALAWDDSPKARAKALSEGFVLHDPTRREAFDGIAMLVVSPGVPHLYPRPNPAVTRAWQAGVPVDNDIGLFFRSFESQGWDRFDRAPQVVAVTGSNGKSTTVALIYHLLHEAGRPAQMAGNIGRSVFDIDPPRDGEVMVLELSSYQTDLARTLAPDIAVLTNLTPDHTDRHGGSGGYFAAKRRLFVEGAPDRAVIGVDEEEGRYLASQLTSGSADDRVIRIASDHKPGGNGWTVSARKGYLSETRKGRQTVSVDLRPMRGLPGAHNHQNACAAYAVLRALGLSPRVIEAGMASFRGLPHRSQPVAECNGITFVNDSKATNVNSAAQALRAFHNIRWIAGGLGKEGGITALHPHLGQVVKAYLIGHSAREFAQQLGALPHEICETMERAVTRAVAEAKAGDTVLLAPAAASFDQYHDFERRGEDFIRCVRVLTGDQRTVPGCPS